MIYFDDRVFKNDELYELYVLRKYLTKHYGEDNAIKLIKEYANSLDDLAIALGKEDIEFFVTFTDISTENIGKPFKLICTATCDSPYGYSSLQTEKITSNTVESTGIKLNDLNKTKYLYNMTDCRSEYVYPTIEIEPVKPNEQITICNLSDNPLKELTITPKTIDSIYIDCERLKIYKFDNYKNEVQITFDDLGISDPNDILKIYWPRLVYGQNIIWTNGLAFITIQWREPRKVGAFV